MRTQAVAGLTFTIHCYRPRIEGLYARVERWTNPASGESHWRVLSRDNVTRLYGTSAESRVADPDEPRRVFAWLAAESYDDRGNAIVYRYKAEDSTGVAVSRVHERNRTPAGRDAQRYLKRIQYGNRTPRQAGEDLTSWLEYTAEGLQQALERTWRRIQEIPVAGRAKLVLRPKQEKLLQLLRARGGLAPQEIWDALEVSKQGAMGLIRPLMKAGMIKRVGTLKHGRYVLK